MSVLAPVINIATKFGKFAIGGVLALFGAKTVSNVSETNKSLIDFQNNQVAASMTPTQSVVRLLTDPLFLVAAGGIIWLLVRK